MAFQAGNSGSSSSGRVTMSEINVTPLVDVMLVLLVIFMVTAPMLQQGIQVELPKTEKAGMEPAASPFILSVSKEGNVLLEKTEIPMNELKSKLKAIFKNRKNKQVYIQGDAGSSYGRVAEVIAEVQASGVTSVGLITEPKEK